MGSAVPEFLHGAAVLQVAAKLLASSRRPARLAVSYVGHSAPEILRLKAGDTIVVNGSLNAVTAGATHPEALERWLSAGVRVVNHERLHAKVIVVGRTAIVGSANISLRAAGGTIAEAALKTTDPQAVSAAHAFIERLICTEGEDISQEWLDEAKKMFPKKRATPAWSEKEPDELEPFRLWLGWYSAEVDWTDRDTKAYEEAVSEAPGAFRPSARFGPVGMVEDSTDDGRLSPGDRVVMLGPRDARFVDFKSIRVVPGSRRRRFVALYRRDYHHPQVTNAAVRRVLAGLKLELPRAEGEAGRWLTNPQERSTVLALWEVEDPGMP
jgi:PLD-like domain